MIWPDSSVSEFPSGRGVEGVPEEPIAAYVPTPEDAVRMAQVLFVYQCDNCMAATGSTTDDPPVQPCWAPGCDGTMRLKERA